MKNYIIKQAKLVNGVRADIHIKDGIIHDIQEVIESSLPYITFGDDYVSAGWIDMHTHCFDKFTIYGDKPDLVGYPHGVCTLVDAGTAGSDTIDEFYEQAKHSRTRVYSFLNISSPGIFRQDELSNLDWLEKDKMKESYLKYPDFILGLKARMSKTVLGDSGNQPLIFAKKMTKILQLPLMVHIGTEPSLLEDIVDLLDQGDIITHIFNPKKNGIVCDQSIKDCIYKAKEKGIYFDLGHGTDSFSFSVADIAFKNGIYVDALSTDIYFENRRNGPVYNLPTTMSKLLHIGYSLEDVIRCVTQKPAQILNLHDLGEIAVGKKADFTIFKVIQGEKELIDSKGVKVIAHQFIQPTHVVVKNQFFDLRED